MTNPTYRVAIIGTGRMGGLMEDENPYFNTYTKPYSHFGSYTAIEQTEVVAVANRGEERMKRFSDRWGITNTYLDYREMIVKEKPDIVSVTTPSFARAEPIIFAAEHGVRGIYAEKGLCASLAEADRIAAAVRSNNVAFNWGASRRHHSGWTQLRDAIARGDIGEPRYATMYAFTDIIKHHPHTLDTVSMLLGDPPATWLEGSLVEKGDLLAEGGRPNKIMIPINGVASQGSGPLENPFYDKEGHRIVPAEGQEIADPMVGFCRVGYENGAEGIYVPTSSSWDLEVIGTEGRAFGWESQGVWRVRQAGKRVQEITEKTIRPVGECPTVNIIRGIIRELETGERTSGNIDVTMQVVEAQYAIAYSHLQGGARVSLPVEDRSLYIPGG